MIRSGTLPDLNEALPWVGSRSPYGWDQIPYQPGGWVLHQSPWSFGFDSQTRGTRENRRTLCESTWFLTGPKTEAHFTAAGMSSQNINSETLRFKRATFYNGLKSKVGLAAAKAATLRVNLNVQGCSIVAPPMHAPSCTPLLLPLLLSHNLPTPRVH
jgi:hypothetical protein